MAVLRGGQDVNKSLVEVDFQLEYIIFFMLSIVVLKDL